ncbi:hypothetical protein [Lentzea sp. CA-135723]|uniref:hypothetical protein n=1 Tax=Lentzea sp. CA-135723 TaxID=3239950 RepID=UPI003D89E9E9
MTVQTADLHVPDHTFGPGGVTTSSDSDYVQSAAIRGPVKANRQLADKAAMLARVMRTTNSFTSALSTFLGTPLRREPRRPDTVRPVSWDDAVLLDVVPGDNATYREGWLAPRIHGPQFRAAAVTALVLEHRLGLDLAGREDLKQGEIPLGQLLRGANRATHFAYTIASQPQDGHPVIHVQATLLLGGVPVALVRETVMWRALTHRVGNRASATRR